MILSKIYWSVEDLIHAFDAYDEEFEFCPEVKFSQVFVEKWRIFVDAQVRDGKVFGEPGAFADIGEAAEFFCGAVAGGLFFGKLDFVVVEEELAFEAEVVGERAFEEEGRHDHDGGCGELEDKRH